MTELNTDTAAADGNVSTQPTKSKSKKNAVREFLDALFVALLLALFIRTFIVQAFKIPSGSMIPTLLIGDHILVNKFVYGIPIPFTNKKLVEFKQPERGEVIVFRYPREPDKDFIKRVVGVPGDTVAMDDGVLYINGHPIPRIPKGTFAYASSERGGGEVHLRLYQEHLDGTIHEVLYNETPQLLGEHDFGPIDVPPGMLFVMGDNRDYSNDSRAWGFLPIENVEGRAIAIYWSWDALAFRPRFDRIGHIIY